MLKAENRLRKGHEISRVYKRGVYGGAEGSLSVKAMPTGLEQSRLVVVVAKKIDKRAVIRNRIRRRLLAVIALEWGTLQGGYDIVISVHADLSKMPTEKLQNLTNIALRKAKVISG